MCSVAIWGVFTLQLLSFLNVLSIEFSRYFQPEIDTRIVTYPMSFGAAPSAPGPAAPSAVMRRCPPSFRSASVSQYSNGHHENRGHQEGRVHQEGRGQSAPGSTSKAPLFQERETQPNQNRSYKHAPVFLCNH